MSDSGKNVGKSRSRPADAHESAADCEWRSERDFSTRGSSSLPPKGTECKYTEEEIYDSGIQSSECCFSSSDVISETDLIYPDSAPDCGYVDSGSLDQEDAARPTSGAASKDSSSKELPSSKESEGDASRGPDSGVVDDEPSSESEDAPSRWDGVVPDCWEVSSESHTAKSVELEDKPSRWDKFFEPADDEGNTHLHLAIIQGCERRALLILSQIPESRYLDIKNHRRETCLHLSVLLRRPYITLKLLLAGAKTGCEDKNGNTALHLACKMNNLACVEALLSRTLIYREMINTVFMYKPKIDFPHMYINEWNYDGLTCTHLAAVHRDFDVLYQLFVNGCDVNIRECKAGYTILHTAVVSGRVELVKFIFQHKNLNKINTEIRNYARLTAYQLSADYPQIASILAENGAIQLSTLDDESEDDDWSDESSDDESFENCEIGSVSQMINNLINSAIPSVITTAS